MSTSARPLKYLLGWLIAGTRGGATRAKIIETLKETPQNANQLANLLGMDYRTIRHHLEVLEKNRIITSAGEGMVPRISCLQRWRRITLCSRRF